jgi:NTE family protein
MALAEDEDGATRETRAAASCLEASAAFADVDGDALAALAAGAVHFCVPAGWSLFAAGDASDGLYLIASGRVGVKPAGTARASIEVGAGQILGELGWLLHEARAAGALALRDSELLWLPRALVDAVAARSAGFALSLARICAGRLRLANAAGRSRRRPRVFVILPNDAGTDGASLATQLTEELSRFGHCELVWDVRASAHTARWFGAIEERSDYVVFLADGLQTAWTRQCCRQADVLLLAADAAREPQAWPDTVAAAVANSGVRVELALLHDGAVAPGRARAWLDATPAAQHHHIANGVDVGRLARLLAQRGVGLVLSGGGARGFAHLGVIRALREARIPIDFVGGASIGSIIAAGVASGWSDAQMELRYRRSFVATNPVDDYTFPFVALTKGRKVSRLLRQEFGEVTIEDLRLPFFCVSANLTTACPHEHRAGALWQALRASVAIPGVLPPVFLGTAVLVDGAAVNNLPVDLMQSHAPGLVLGSDAGAVRSFEADGDASDQPPFWRFFSRGAGGRRRINIFQILMRAGLAGGASSAAHRRECADLTLRPPLEGIDLLDWQAFDRAIAAGYAHATAALAAAPQLPRLPAPDGGVGGLPQSLTRELERRRRLAG